MNVENPRVHVELNAQCLRNPAALRHSGNISFHFSISEKDVSPIAEGEEEGKGKNRGRRGQKQRDQHTKSLAGHVKPPKNDKAKINK